MIVFILAKAPMESFLVQCHFDKQAGIQMNVGGVAGGCFVAHCESETAMGDKSFFKIVPPRLSLFNLQNECILAMQGFATLSVSLPCKEYLPCHARLGDTLLLQGFYQG